MRIFIPTQDDCAESGGRSLHDGFFVSTTDDGHITVSSGDDSTDYSVTEAHLLAAALRCVAKEAARANR